MGKSSAKDTKETYRTSFLYKRPCNMQHNYLQFKKSATYQQEKVPTFVISVQSVNNF